MYLLPIAAVLPIDERMIQIDVVLNQTLFYASSNKVWLELRLFLLANQEISANKIIHTQSWPVIISLDSQAEVPSMYWMIKPVHGVFVAIGVSMKRLQIKDYFQNLTR